MSSNQTSARHQFIRRMLLVFGTLMWIAVAFVAYRSWSVWKHRAEQTESSTVHDPIFQPILENPDQSETDSPANGEEGVTDASSTSTGLPLPAWDEKGINDFELIERSGRKVTKADLLGKPWAVCFIFTRCAGPCPRITGQMRLLQDRLQGLDARLVTISVDPENDTPEKLQQYASQFDADPEKWLFLTGERNTIYRLIIDSFRMPVREEFGEDRKPGYEVAHSTNVLLVNAEGRVIKKFNAQDDAQMVSLWKAMKKEAEKVKPSVPNTQDAPQPDQSGEK